MGISSFISTIIAAGIGSLVAPAFSQFLNEEKNKRKQQLSYLEELYLLSRQLGKYGESIHIRTARLLNLLEKNEDISTLPPEPEYPYSRIQLLLDFYLNSRPDDLYNKMEEINTELMNMYQPIAELIGYKYKIENREEHNVKAFELCLSVKEKCQTLSKEIAAYAKEEKNKINIESNKSVFNKIKS